MNDELPYHDPKIVPSPEEGEEITVELTSQEIELLDERVRAGGHWSREEYFRWALQKLIKAFAAGLQDGDHGTSPGDAEDRRF